MAIALSAVLLLTACGSAKPAKYRKKRGCDCPHWNKVPASSLEGVHARFSPEEQHHTPCALHA